MVIHDSEEKRFYKRVDGKEAELSYIVESEDVLNYKSTYTPHELRGKGLAGEITQAALKYALDHNKKVNPGCPYVREYIARHPEFEILLVD